METFLIFIPSSLYKERPGILYGEVRETKEEHVKSYYILGKADHVKHTEIKNERCGVVGYYCKNIQISDFSFRPKSDWLNIGLDGCDFNVHEIFSSGNIIDTSKPCQIVCIVYDHQTFIESEFLLQNTDYDSTVYGDHFKTLANKLNSEESFYNLHSFSALLIRNVITQWIIKLLLLVINCLLACSNALNPALKYTTLGLHMQVFLGSLVWVLQSVIGKRNISVKVLNYIVAIIVDISCGMLLLYWLNTMTSSPSQLLLDSGEVVVRTLRDLLHWLMGIPAGLKLNYAFNNMLGRFFLYHINLWWTFLVVAKPLLEITFYIFLCLGQLGVTFQASILADLLALVSFHIYCIYVYAARLYNLQVSGLVALWRLFLGRKRNPLRGRVDSCQYSSDQLFVGTLAFTILLFLLPTTLMYYIVFTTLRLVVIGLGGVLTRVRYVLQCLPLCVSILWLFQSSAVSSTINLVVQLKRTKGPLFLFVRPVSGSWWKTVQYCMPEPVHPPPKVEWGRLVGNLVSGELIYPV